MSAHGNDAGAPGSVVVEGRVRVRGALMDPGWLWEETTECGRVGTGECGLALHTMLSFVEGRVPAFLERVAREVNATQPRSGVEAGA